ncbi:hypothetical protein [Faecalimonas sp.]
MRKKTNKLTIFLLVFVLCFSFSPYVLAENNLSSKSLDKSKKYYLDVIDENNNIITLLVEEDIYYPNVPSTRSIPSYGGGSSSGHKVGEIKTVKVKITNAQLGAIGYTGSVLTGAGVTKLGKLAGQTAAKVVGSSIAGGVGTITAVAAAVGTVNTLIGNNGFQVTMKFKWTHFEHKIQGIDLYDWSLNGVNIVPY